MTENGESYSLVKTWEEGERINLDVRDMLEAGGEPYAVIMKTLHELPSGKTLSIHALFEPKPLIHQVGQMGYQSECRRVDADHWVLNIWRS